MEWLKHAFAIGSVAEVKPNPAQHVMIERLCSEVVRRRMATPALLLLEMSQPLNYVSAQFLRFIQPIATAIADAKQYEELTRFLEQRGSIEYLCRRLEALEAARQSKPQGSHGKTAPKAIDLPADRAR